MKSLRRNPDEAALLEPELDSEPLRDSDPPAALGPARWNWNEVRSVLVVRLRSIGDTVLSTPSLIALRRFLPETRIDILLEDWVAPVLDGLTCVDNVIRVERKNLASRIQIAKQLRATNYDVGYNFHGGSTATFLLRASGAKHRIGYANYRYSSLHNHLSPPSSILWGSEKTHSVEQQLALVGWTGVPVSDRPETRLAVTPDASAQIDARLRAAGLVGSKQFAFIHPSAAFDTKRWAAEKFARVAEALGALGITAVAVARHDDAQDTNELQLNSAVPVIAFTDLSLPLVTALAARARLFVGNDSGIAHIAAAVGCPSVVIFGSSNVAHWRPWASAPAEVVREDMPCAPCPGYTCEEFGTPECIKRVPVERVLAAIERVLNESRKSN